MSGSVYLHQSEGEHPLGKRISIRQHDNERKNNLKAYIYNTSNVKVAVDISVEDTPLEILKNCCEQDAESAKFLFPNEGAYQQLMRDNELDENISSFDLKDVNGCSIHAEWNVPLNGNPEIKNAIAELEAENMPISFVCSIAAIVAA